MLPVLMGAVFALLSGLCRNPWVSLLTVPISVGAIAVLRPAKVPGCGKLLRWTSIKSAMIRPMWSNVSQIELDFFMAIARRLGPDDVVDAIGCAKKV